ncbi:MAG: NYN domain-containing protein [Acidobacteria bacterium]|nr:NYN domain-containing protein [Acidobacteriota bacterium]MBI3658336.1 NYN domain-containing protein [Acidobacteriota bacterium]
MPYVVDGNNLIGHTTSLHLNDDRSRQALVQKISLFHNAGGGQVVIVFDGEPCGLVPAGLTLGGVRVLYAGGRSDADTKIKSMVSARRNPQDLIVVSSDTAVYNYARQHGAKAMKCHEFNIKMTEVIKGKSAEESKPEVGELNEWYRYFGLEKDEKDEG